MDIRRPKMGPLSSTRISDAPNIVHSGRNARVLIVSLVTSPDPSDWSVKMRIPHAHACGGVLICSPTASLRRRAYGTYTHRGSQWTGAVRDDATEKESG